jgi:hypothetical protein
MDPVLLKRSLRDILKSLGLHGTILRHEVENDGESHFSTFIAFEAPVSRGKDFVREIVLRVKELPFIQQLNFSSEYTRLTESVSDHPVVHGVSIAETSTVYVRQGSSGIKYANPYTSVSHQVVDSVSSVMNKYVTPAVGILQQLAGTRYRFLTTSHD